MKLNFSSLDGINYVNIVLMLASLCLAYFFPFELFLISFIFMGPLHYLTELSWLERKDFFLAQKWTALFIVLILLVFGLFYFFPIPAFIPVFHSLLFAALVLTGALVFAIPTVFSVVLCISSFVLIWVLKWHEQEWYLIVFTLFLPTIIHITLFTALFMLSGALKNKMDVSGWLGLVCFVFCSIFFFINPYYNSSYEASTLVQTWYYDFVVLNKKMSDFFHYGYINRIEDIYTSKEGIIIMQFIGFSYCYHYLNWFTKTSIIKWHQISVQRIISICIIYFIVLALFPFDKKLAISVLTLLSAAHLVFEFPLNWVVIKSII